MDEKGDVGLEIDLIYTIKNLCAIENHAKSSYYVTGDEKWRELNDIIRQMRSRWMKLIVKKEESEIWCVTKHLHNALMGMEEVTNRLYKIDNENCLMGENDSKMLNGLILELNDIKGGK